MRGMEADTWCSKQIYTILKETFYGNYKEEKISRDLEEYEKFESQIMKSNNFESEEYSEIIGKIEPLKIAKKENEINKNFIAWGNKICH